MLNVDSEASSTFSIKTLVKPVPAATGRDHGRMWEHCMYNTGITVKEQLKATATSSKCRDNAIAGRILWS